MRTPLQGVKHTLGTTTRDRAAVRSTATKAPVGLWLARGSQRLGMSNVVAVSYNPYEESKEHGRPQAAKKSPVGSFLVPRVAAPSIRACLGRLAFLRIVSCAERIRVGDRLIIPKQQAPTQKAGDSRLFGVKIS